MVARTPPKQQKKMAPHLSLTPTLLRETVKKVDKCMARLQELQYTVRGGTKVISCTTSPPRTYFPTSLRCTNANNSRRSPPAVNAEDWRKMSLPAMLLVETMGEVLQATQFARNIVQASKTDDPKTPTTRRRNSETNPAGTMQARRKREKQVVLQSIRSESDSSLTRAKSKINFKTNNRQECCDKENCRYIANRISPRNRPWARKTVLFPNPLFHSSPPQQKSSRTKSPAVAKNSRQTPHKFLIKSPPESSSKFRVKIKSPPPISISPIIKKKSQEAEMRRSFSPSRLASRLVSPLKRRKSIQKNEESKFVEIGRNQQTTYKFFIKSSPQGKIKSCVVSNSPIKTNIWGKKSSSKGAKTRRSFSPSRHDSHLTTRPI